MYDSAGGKTLQQQMLQQHQHMQQMHHHQSEGINMHSSSSMNLSRQVSPAPSPSSAMARPPPTSSSSSGVPDYTQVSPAKMALRRHLSQEKLAVPSMASKTIGDLVNGEIERTLEISNQSIINAAVNMSTNSTIPVEVFNVQRPERVNVRGPEDYLQQFGGAAYRGQELRGRSPGPFGGGGGGGGAGGSGHPTASSHPKGGSSAATSAPSASKPTGNLFMASYPPNSLNAFGYQSGAGNSGGGGGGGSSTQTTCLPRAEMKPYLEQYFLDDSYGKGPGGQPRGGGKLPMHGNNPGNGGGNSRMAEDPDSHRMTGQLEGLAASLQARVRATLKIKEEHEVIGGGSGMERVGPMALHHHQRIKQEGKEGIVNE